MFNTLKYARMLEEVGFSREQSEATVHILVEVMKDRLATKQDIQGLHQKMNQQAIAMAQEFQQVRQELQQQAVATAHEFQNQAAKNAHEFQKVRQEIQLLKSDLVIKMGAMQAAAVGLVVALIKLL